MIRLEYDVQTAGVRVSFVVRDRAVSMPSMDDLLKQGESVGDKWLVAQNLDTMKVLIKMLNYEIKHAKSI